MLDHSTLVCVSVSTGVCSCWTANMKCRCRRWRSVPSARNEPPGKPLWTERCDGNGYCSRIGIQVLMQTFVCCGYFSDRVAICFLDCRKKTALDINPSCLCTLCSLSLSLSLSGFLRSTRSLMAQLCSSRSAGQARKVISLRHR